MNSQSRFGTLTLVVILLAGLQLGDFLFAPETVFGALKSMIGARIMKDGIEEVYLTKGAEAAKQLCGHPAKMLGYYYVCDIGYAIDEDHLDTYASSPDKVWVYTYSDANSALDKIHELFGSVSDRVAHGEFETQRVLMSTKPLRLRMYKLAQPKALGS